MTLLFTVPLYSSCMHNQAAFWIFLRKAPNKTKHAINLNWQTHHRPVVFHSKFSLDTSTDRKETVSSLETKYFYTTSRTTPTSTLAKIKKTPFLQYLISVQHLDRNRLTGEEIQKTTSLGMSRMSAKILKNGHWYLTVRLKPKHLMIFTFMEEML